MSYTQFLEVKGAEDWLRLAARDTTDPAAEAARPTPTNMPPQDMLPNRQPESVMDKGKPVTPPLVPPGARTVPDDHLALRLMRTVGKGDKQQLEIRATPAIDQRRRIKVNLSTAQLGGNVDEARRILCLAFAGRLQGWREEQAVAYTGS